LSIPPAFQELIGQWSGTKKLWLSPAETLRESSSSMSVAAAAQGRFLTLQYNWDYEGSPAAGFLLLGYEEKSGKLEAAWVDSWHMQDLIMTYLGELVEDGSPAPQGSVCSSSRPGLGLEHHSCDETWWSLAAADVQHHPRRRVSHGGPG
jgi:hypothetical protein